MNKRIKALLVVVAIVVIVSSTFLIGTNNILFPTKTTNPSPTASPEPPTPTQKTAADYSQSIITMKVDSVDMTKGDNLSPTIQIGYTIFVDGQPFDTQSISDPNVIIDQLDWSNFSIKINGATVEPVRNEYNPILYYQVPLPSSQEIVPIQVLVNYHNTIIEKYYTASQLKLTMDTINQYWTAHTSATGQLDGDSYVSMHKAFDEYALAISSMVFLRQDLLDLKSRFTSLSEWYSWLEDTFYDAPTVIDAWHNFQAHANSTGLSSKVNQVIQELESLRSFPWNSLYEYPSVAISSVTLGVLEGSLNSAQTGDKVESAIISATESLRQITINLGIRFFNWVNSTSPNIYEKGAAYNAYLYLNDLNTINSLKNYYGVAFSSIIKASEQYKPTGQDGVAWWPASYSYFPVVGNLPFTPESGTAPTSLPLSEVRFKYYDTSFYKPGETQSFDVYLATRSLVQSFVQTHGLSTDYMPLTDSEAPTYGEIRSISNYYLATIETSNNYWVTSGSLLKDCQTMSSAYSSFQKIAASFNVTRTYSSAENFLQFIDQNVWTIVETTSDASYPPVTSQPPTTNHPQPSSTIQPTPAIQPTGTNPPNTKKVSWTFATGDKIDCTPLVYNSKVYVGSYDGKVYCLDGQTGVFIWNYTTYGAVLDSPVQDSGRIYFGSWDGRLYCLDATSGTMIWTYPTPKAVTSSPAIVDGKIYFGSYDSKVYCLDESSGALLWNYATGGAVLTSPVVANSKVYFGSQDGKMYCLDTSGVFVWSYTTGDKISFSSCVQNGRVFVGSDDRKIYCLDATNGSLFWSYTTNGAVASPSVFGNRVFVGSWDSKMYCLDVDTGQSVWNYSAGSVITSCPAIVNGFVYFGSWDNDIYCLNEGSGGLVWSYSTAGSVSSSPTISNGKVYVGSWDYKIYCLSA